MQHCTVLCISAILNVSLDLIILSFLCKLHWIEYLTFQLPALFEHDRILRGKCFTYSRGCTCDKSLTVS